MTYILILPMILLIFFPFYMLRRNGKTAAFRTKIIDAVFDDLTNLDAVNKKMAIYKKHSYDKMMFKFWKPLKIEAWFTPEECELLNYG